MYMRLLFENKNKLLTFLLVHIIGIAFLLALQFLMYGFLPAVDSSLPMTDQKIKAVLFINRIDRWIILEAIIGLSFIFVVSIGILKNRKILLLIVCFELIILLLTMILFSKNYTNRFPIMP
jgi:hypothetical protein